ncbi:MAG: tripeptide aminopeptidase PepT, partial [Bradymonadales bacterium]|nr:tripeptide aminopeptidase PepT [Bradymonadales bacterium]
MEHTPRWFDDPSIILSQTNLVDRFLELVAFDTQSDPDNPACPSTPGQLELAHFLVGKLNQLGIDQARVDEHGYLYACCPGLDDRPAVGLIAHLDTAPAFNGQGVKPVRHPDYDGGVIRLNDQVELDPESCPALLQHVGDTLITADGTTLLGADDKAGIAEILAALEVLAANPQIPRPPLRIAFTPDEEIGRGADHFDLDGFGAKAAYTVDGGPIGEVNSETFSADKASLVIEGVSVHPGYARGEMVNAMDWAAR